MVHMPHLPTHTSNGAADTNGDTASATSSTEKSATVLRKLSTFSKQYDVNGDGVLDDAEMAMRDMDKTGRGYLTNDKVYELMKEQLKTQKDLIRFKKVVIGMAVLVVLLALANIGTSFAAAHLAKDTSASQNEELINAHTHEVLSTQRANDSYEVHLTASDASGRRRLCSKNGEDENNDGAEDIDCETSSYVTMDEDEGEKMIKKCKDGHYVNLLRTWSNGDDSSMNICPPDSGSYNKNGISTLSWNNGETITIELDNDGGDNYYRLDGDRLTQDDGEICDVDGDCDSESCVDKSTGAVNSCQARCRRLRFGPSRLQPCLDSCEHKICAASK